METRIIINSNEINYGITDHIVSFPIFYDKDNFVFKFNIKKTWEIDKFSLNNLLKKPDIVLTTKHLMKELFNFLPGI